MFADVRRDNDSHRSLVAAADIFEKFAGGLVAEVAAATGDSLLEFPGIRAFLKQDRIVVRLKHNGVDISGALANEVRDLAKVGDHGERVVTAGNAKGHGVSCIMEHTERLKAKIADRKLRSRKKQAAQLRRLACPRRGMAAADGA